MNKFEWDKAGCQTMSEVSSFLGGIFFASIIMLIQQKEMFEITLIDLRISEQISVLITELQIVAIPLALSIVTFIFSAIRFAGACSNVNPADVDYSAKSAYVTFKVGFLSTLISLSAILLSIDTVVGLFGILFIIGTSIYLERR